MKTFKYAILFLCTVFFGNCLNAQTNLAGVHFDYKSTDTVFTEPYIDIDEWRNTPVRHRYMHGGFSDGTRFSFYFPEKKNYKGHFFQYATPFPDSETSAQANTDEFSMIGFSVAHGAYFIETNCGGRLDFSVGQTRPADISAYRANAACADFSRVIAKQLFGGNRPYGYIYGGSGGAYRTIGSIENTQGVWDGAVPIVMGSSMAIPNVFCVRMHCMRILKGKFPQIIDAMDAGGSGNIYAGLNQEEYQALKEATRMGFPKTAWYGYDKMGVHGFLVLYKGVVNMDRKYFEEDFWNKEGYLGANPTESLMKARLKKKSVIKRGIGQDEGESKGWVEKLSEADRGSIDKSWKSMGGGEDKPVAYELGDVSPDVDFIGGDLIILSGKAKGQVLQITDVKGATVILAPTNAMNLLAQIAPGDSVQIDNSNFLAVQTYYHHQVPTKDLYVWNQFRDMDGNPIYPQRPVNIGPIITGGASGSLPAGKIKGKVIVVESMMDSEAFPWQADWYRNKVKDYLGDKIDDNFRLWYVDHGVHGDANGLLMDASRTISYQGTVQQALLDLSDWVEKGIAPARTTYTINDGQVEVPATADDRGGIQPVATATINNGKKIEVAAGTPVTIHVVAEVPKGMGKVVEAGWTFNEDHQAAMIHPKQLFTRYTDMKKAKYSDDGCRVEFDETIVYDKPGTYIPAVRVVSQRDAKKKNYYTRIENIDRVRIVVK
jgi:hypothetical protein